MVGNHHFHPLENGWLSGTRQFIIIEQLSFHLQLAFLHPEFPTVYPTFSSTKQLHLPPSAKIPVVSSDQFIENVGKSGINSDQFIEMLFTSSDQFIYPTSSIHLLGAQNLQFMGGSTTTSTTSFHPPLVGSSSHPKKSSCISFVGS